MRRLANRPGRAARALYVLRSRAEDTAPVKQTRKTRRQGAFGRRRVFKGLKGRHVVRAVATFRGSDIGRMLEVCEAMLAALVVAQPAKSCLYLHTRIVYDSCALDARWNTSCAWNLPGLWG